MESRSIYSARIHIGRSAAGREKDLLAISSSVHFIEVERALLQSASERRPVYVLDESGKLLGEISSARVHDPPPEAFPLEIATAADFTTETRFVRTSDGEKTIDETFAAEAD